MVYFCVANKFMINKIFSKSQTKNIKNHILVKLTLFLSGDTFIWQI